MFVIEIDEALYVIAAKTASESERWNVCEYKSKCSLRSC